MQQRPGPDLMANTPVTPQAAPRRVLFLIPALVFAVVAGYFLWGLDPTRDPSAIPSVMIDKPVPAFALSPIQGMTGDGLTSDDLTAGKVTLVNFFASWCVPCRVEHPLLMELAARDGVHLYGINYKNKPEEARPWLASLGNPYEKIGADEDGRVGIDWGVYGLPETFIIDAKGRIRYRRVGPIDRFTLDRDIWPLIQELRQ